jgi:hypothetical protein
MPQYRNKFLEPAHFEHIILNKEGKKKGTFRLKPNRVLWKPVNAERFYSVTLDDFADWIMSPAAEARRGVS